METAPFSRARLRSTDARLHRSPFGLDPPQADASAAPSECFQCAGCGDVIGVYEPLVVACGDRSARTTSRAAEPDLRGSDGTYYHCECYLET
ncbi:MAG TPA: hypothetical protein VK781_07485 [Solirubrobacteraceae bacterium]|jgi:hypothetical protein|nr:hypothetical protein [Solirubrobacteraceae bacterium]